MRRLVLLAVAVLLSFAATAQAAAPPCPTAPDPIEAPPVLTDTDRLVRELRDARIEQAASCAAVSGGLAAIEQSTGDSGAKLGDLLTLASGDQGVAVHETAPADMSSAQTVELGPDSRAEAAELAAGSQSVVWFAVGALIALFGGYFLIRRDA